MSTENFLHNTIPYDTLYDKEYIMYARKPWDSQLNLPHGSVMEQVA